MNQLWVRLGCLFTTVIASVLMAIMVFGFLFLVGTDPNGSNPVINCDSAGNCDGQAEDMPNPSVAPPQLVQLAVPFLLGVLVIGVAGIGVGVFSGKRLTTPLSELADAANAIGQGEFSRRVAENGSDEMVDVARAFNRMAADLDEAEQLRRNLMADVSHELRTPLTVLEGNLRAAVDGVVSLDEEELANLYGQTRHLSRLVNDLQDLALAEANTLSLHFEPVSLHTLLMETAATFQPIAEEQAIELMVELHPVPKISADSVRLRQVFHNLISNALRHTPAEGTITIRLEQNEEVAVISIRDTGVGILPAQLPHIFDRFFRTDRSRSTATGGFGLGLAIVKALIKLHNGSISVQSAVGVGTTFVIRLPHNDNAENFLSDARKSPHTLVATS